METACDWRQMRCGGGLVIGMCVDRSLPSIHCQATAKNMSGHDTVQAFFVSAEARSQSIVTNVQASISVLLTAAYGYITAQVSLTADKTDQGQILGWGNRQGGQSTLRGADGSKCQTYVPAFSFPR